MKADPTLAALLSLAQSGAAYMHLNGVGVISNHEGRFAECPDVRCVGWRETLDAAANVRVGTPDAAALLSDRPASLADSEYEVGRQPCASFNPQREANAYASWNNVHECYGPFDGRPRGCSGTVSFCVTCASDHHSGGYDRCPIPAPTPEAE